jgi:hypothetical protein
MDLRRSPHIPAALVAVTLVTLACLVGCKSADQKAREEKDHRAIRALNESAREAILHGDREKWLACFHGSPMEMRFAAEIFELWQTSFRFQDAFIAAYGPKAWRKLQDTNEANVRMPPTDREYWDGIRIYLKGDRARCAIGYRKQMWWVDRFSDGWSARAGDLLNQHSSNIDRELITDHILTSRATAAVMERMIALLRTSPPSYERFLEQWTRGRQEAVLKRRKLGAFDANKPVEGLAPASQPVENRSR